MVPAIVLFSLIIILYYTSKLFSIKISAGISKAQSHVKLFFYGATGPSRSGPIHYRGFTITLRHTTRRRTPLDESSSDAGGST
jgi:hypothetical protein